MESSRDEEKNELKSSGGDSYASALQRSALLEQQISQHPRRFRVLTGDRPTGCLHVGHLFGSLLNRLRLQQLGVELLTVIADYQVLNDRENIGRVDLMVEELVLDYLSVGINPECGYSFIFPHSYVPQIHQLMLLFLPLVSVAELERNPTVKEEARAAGLSQLNAGMFTYPVHQAADILFCEGSVVPVGKDQLPHLELCRQIAQRFNRRYCPEQPLFPEPQALLSEAPAILGLDGASKMSKSRANAINLSASAEETAALIKRAKTDSERSICYQPLERPEVANLLLLLSLCSGQSPQQWADQINQGGAGQLKRELTEALNEYLRPIRERRLKLQQDRAYLRQVLRWGMERAVVLADWTLNQSRKLMGLDFFTG